MKNFFEKAKAAFKSLGKCLMGFVAVTSYDELFRLAVLVGGSMAMAIIIFRKLMRDTSLRRTKLKDTYSQSIDFPREVEEDMSILHPLMRGPAEAMFGKKIVAKNFDKNRHAGEYSFPHRNQYMEEAGRYDKKKGGKKSHGNRYAYQHDYFKEAADLYENATRSYSSRRRNQPEQSLVSEVSEIFKGYGLPY